MFSPLLVLCYLLGIHAVIAVVSLPMARRKVPLNGTYGFRTPKTMSNDRIWYAANEASGKLMLRASAVSAAFTVLGFFLLPARLYAPLAFAFWIGALLVALVLSFVTLGRIEA